MSDSSSQYTQCPFCETTFTISEPQLRMAKGLVRCGSCKQVFRADQRLVTSPPPLLTESVGQPSASPAATPAPATSEPSFAIDLNTSLEGDPEPDNQASAEVVPEPERAPPPTMAQDFAAGPSLRAAQRFQHAPGESDQHDRSALASQKSKPQATRKPTTQDVDKPAAMEPIDGDIISPQMLRELTRPEQPTHAMRHWRYGLLVALLLLFLGGQYFWFSRAHWLQNADIRRTLTPLCTSLNCDFPTWKAPDEIVIIEQALQAHPDHKAGKRLQLTLRNNAQWPQTYPQLKIRFYDLNRRVIAARVFNPTEYLGYSPKTLLAPHAEQQVILDLVDPGAQAVNYELTFI